MADIKHNVNVNVQGKGVKKTSKDLEDLNGAINKTGKNSRTLDRNIKGNAAMSANASKNFSKQAQGMQGILVPAYAEVAARVFALTAAYTALENAADFSILLRGQQMYAEMTGRNLGTVAKQLQEATGYMIDFQAASSAAALSGSAGMTSEEMVRMAKAAKSASVALGRNMTDALDRLTRGLVKGEPEILDELGILIRLDTVYKEYAQTLGVSTNALSEFQKQQARTEAILGQAERKFGDIGERAGINEFSRLQATAFDQLRQFGTLVNDALSPIAKFLSEFQEGLTLIFALIAKNLIGKIFPVLGEFAAKVEKIPRGLQARSLMSQRRVRTAERGAEAADQSIFNLKREQSLLTRQLKRIDFGPNTLIGRALGTDKMSQKKQFEQIKKSLPKILANAKKWMGEDGIVGKGPLKDLTRAQLTQLENSFNKVTKGAKNAAGAIDLLGVKTKVYYQRTKAFIAGGASFIWKGFSKVLAGVGTTMGLLSKAGNLALRVFSGFTILTFVIDLFNDADRTFSKTKQALNDLADATKSAAESVNNTRLELNAENLTGSFSDLLRSEEFKANIQVQLSEAFNDAIKKIDWDTTTASGAISKLIDAALGKFGFGTRADAGNAIADAIVASTGLGTRVPEEVAKALSQATNFTKLVRDPTAGLTTSQDPEAQLAFFNKLINGIKLSKKESETLRSGLAALGEEELTSLISQTGAFLKLNQNAKDTAKQLKVLDGIFKDLTKAQLEFSNSLNISTPFDKMADGARKTIKELESLNVNVVSLASAIEFAGSDSGIKAFDDIIKATKRVEDAKLAVTKAEQEGDKIIIRARKGDLELAKQQLEALNKIGRAKLGELRVNNQLKDVLFKARFGEGADPIESQERYRTTADRMAAREQVMSSLKEISGIQAITAFRKLEIENLRDKQALEAINLSYIQQEIKEGKNLEENKLSELNILKKVNKIEEEINKKQKDRSPYLPILGKYISKEAQAVSKIMDDYRQILDSAELRGAMEGAPAEFLQKAAIRQTLEVMRAGMEEIAKDFGAALKTVASGFNTAMKAEFESIFTGAETNFRETVGKSFMEAGSTLFANATTNSIFSRTGIVGKGLEGIFGSQFADMAMPKTDLEYQQGILDELKLQTRIAVQGNKDIPKTFETAQGNLLKGLEEDLELLGTDFKSGINTFAKGFGDALSFFNAGDTSGGSGILGTILSVGKTLFTGLANGGIAKGGFRMYANGGIATEPHLGMIGEGKYNEAIVPLPDGKSIPVIGNTGGGNVNNVSVNVSIDSNGQAKATTDGAAGKELGYRISQAVQEEIIMQQRPGGLLSSY